MSAGLAALRAGWAAGRFVGRAVKFARSPAGRAATAWVGSAAAGYRRKTPKYSSGDSNVTTATPAGTASSNYASVSTKHLRRKRYSRRSKRMFRKRKLRKRRFNRRVAAVIRGHQKMSWLQDTASNVPAAITSTTAPTVAPFNNITGKLLKDGRQFIMGASMQYCLMPGPAWSQARGLGYIAGETSKFTQDVNGVPIAQNQYGKESFKIWVSNCRLQITFENNSYKNTVAEPGESWQPQDITADVYEFVAKQDVTDADFRTAKETIYNICSETTVPGVDIVTTDPVNVAPGNMFTKKGTTPMQIRDLGKWWKLVGKTRVNVPYNSEQGIYPSQTLTFSSKKHIVDYSKWNGLYAKKGVTRSFLIILEPDLTSSKVVSSPANSATVPYCNIWSHTDWHYKPVNGSLSTTSISCPNFLFSETAGSVN